MKRIWMVVALGALLPTLALAQAELQPVALVKLGKTEPITVKQLKAKVALQETQLKRSLTKEERRQVLDLMVDEKLFLQAADRDKIVVSDVEVNQQIAQVKNSMAQLLGHQPSDQEFDSALRTQTGMDMVAYREELKKSLVLQKFLMSKKGAMFQSIKPPTEDEIKQAYELSITQMARPAAVRLSMLFVPIGTEANGKAKAKEAAEKLRKDVGNDSAKFDEFVMRGQVAGAGWQGTSGGYIYKTAEAQQVVGPDFLNIAFSLKINEISSVIEGVKGYQIIKVTESYAQKIMELNDPYQLGQAGTVRDYINQYLMSQKSSAMVEKATKELVDELKANKPYQIFENNLNW